MKHYGNWDVTGKIKGNSVEATGKIKGNSVEATGEIKGEELEITGFGSFKSILIKGDNVDDTFLQVNNGNGLILKVYTDNLEVNGVVSADKFNGNATSATKAQTIEIKESETSASYYSVSYNDNILSFTKRG